MKKCSSIKQTRTTIFHAPLIKQNCCVTQRYWYSPRTCSKPAGQRPGAFEGYILQNRSTSVLFQGPLGGLIFKDRRKKNSNFFHFYLVYKLICTDHQTKYQVPVLLYSRTNKLVLLYSRTHLQHVHNTRVVTASHWACGTGCRALLMMMVV